MAALGQKPALELMEEAAYLVRGAPLRAFAAYYLGTLPFLLAYLYFWADMRQHPTASGHLAPASLGLAILFVVMSIGQSLYSQRLRALLSGGKPSPFRRIVLVQSALQPLKLVIVPLAACAVVPLASVFGFFQSLMAIQAGDAGFLQAYFAARRQSRLWRSQSWGVIGVTILVGLMVYLNCVGLLIFVPQLLKSFLGIDSQIARSPIILLNSTFFMIVLAITYAVVDPLLKAAYVLRCFYGESLATGEDLRAQIKTIASHAALILILIGVVSGSKPAYAQPAPSAPAAPQVQDLNRSIDRVLDDPRYSWRFPRAQESKSWFVRWLENAGQAVRDWLDRFFDWLNKRFQPSRQGDGGLGPPGKQRPAAPRFWFYFLLVVAFLVAAIILIRSFRKKSRAPAKAVPATVAAPEITSEDIHPGELPADDWILKAREYVSKNDLRLAVRAFYLANLAYLGSRSLLSIDRGKSNLDYARELRRRARDRAEIVPVFGDTLGVFERSWYGMYPVDRETVARVEANLTATRSRVEQ